MVTPEETQLYMDIFKALNCRPTILRTQVINFIAERGTFTMTELIQTLGYDKSTLYPLKKWLMGVGFVEELPQPEMPEYVKDWGSLARANYRKRMGITVHKEFRFTPEKAVKGIDEKIDELHRLREALLSLGGLESQTKRGEKRW